MTDSTEIDTEQVADDIVSNLRIPEGGTVRKDLKVVTPFVEYSHKACVSIQAGIPMSLASEILRGAEERVDLRRRGKVGEVIVDLDNRTWKLKIEGDEE